MMLHFLWLAWSFSFWSSSGFSGGCIQLVDQLRAGHSWGPSVLHGTSPCDYLELPHSMVVSRQHPKTQKWRLQGLFEKEDSSDLKSKQCHLQHIPLVRASHRATQTHGEGTGTLISWGEEWKSLIAKGVQDWKIVVAILETAYYICL